MSALDTFLPSIIGNLNHHHFVDVYWLRVSTCG
jgi:hypothetical protein